MSPSLPVTPSQNPRYDLPARVSYNAFKLLERRHVETRVPDLNIWTDHGKDAMRQIEQEGLDALGQLQCLVSDGEPHAAQKLRLIEHLRALLKIAPLLALVAAAQLDFDEDLRRAGRRPRRDETVYHLGPIALVA